MHSPELPTGGRFSADFKQSKQAPDLAANLRAVRAKTGKSFAAQVIDIYKLGRGFGKLTSQDYFFYGLYDDNRLDWPAKALSLATASTPASSAGSAITLGGRQPTTNFWRR